MIFAAPNVDWNAALQTHAVKTILPTTLDSAQYRGLGADVLQRAIFSAGIHKTEILDVLFGVTADALAGQIDSATASLLLDAIAKLNGVKLDDNRINLMLSVNQDTAAGTAQTLAGNDPNAVAAFPAWEFYRLEDRVDPRDWPARWRVAGAAASDGYAVAALNDFGVMAALKDSEIWYALGETDDDSIASAGGGPPYAFRSGMWRRPFSREQSIQVGLLDPGDVVTPKPLRDFNADLQSRYDVRDANLRAALEATGLVKFQEGVMVPA